MLTNQMILTAPHHDVVRPQKRFRNRYAKSADVEHYHTSSDALLEDDYAPIVLTEDEGEKSVADDLDEPMMTKAIPPDLNGNESDEDSDWLMV